jgi:hypothetical protein
MARKRSLLLAALIAWPVWAQDYNPTLIPPQLLGSPQTMIPLNGGDDSTRVVQFAFPFEYYGQTFTSAWVSSNGFVSFYGPNNLCCDGMPMNMAQRNTIYGYWTDLIGNPNPYYRMTDTSALFGWYGTKEYGTNNSLTFEIGLFSDGKIQFNYGSVANTFHTVSAGITGPTATDNIQLFYGTNVQSLSFQSGLLSPVAPEPVFSPVSVVPTPAPTPAPSPLEITIPDQEEQIVAAEAAIEEAIEAAPEEVTAPEMEGASEITEETVSEEVTPEEEPAEDANDPPPPPGLFPGALPQASENTIVVSRKDRNVDFFQSEAVEDAATFSRETVLQVTAQNVAFVAQADAQDAQLYGEQTTTEATGSGYILGPTEGPTFAAAPATGMGDFSTPAGQAQQMELLGMQADMAAGQVIDVGDVNDGDNETMSQLAAIPAGYSAYTQARIPDAPFYQPRDIYKGRRIPDQNMALYRMMRGQDALWEDMVDAQYE